MIDSRIKDLEQKESELIQMLSKTNQMELLAMNDLKKIINEEDPEFFMDIVQKM